MFKLYYFVYKIPQMKETTCYDLQVNQLRIALGSGADQSVKIIDSKIGIPFGKLWGRASDL